MRKYFLLSCLVSIQILTINCKKSATDNFDTTPYSGTTNLLFGTWEVRITSGTFGNCQNATYSPGNGNMWKFFEGGYEEYEKGQLLSNGNYILLTDSCAATGTLMEAIVLPQSGYLKIYCDVSKDSLIMYRCSSPGDVSMGRFVRMKK